MSTLRLPRSAHYGQHPLSCFGRSRFIVDEDEIGSGWAGGSFSPGYTNTVLAEARNARGTRLSQLARGSEGIPLRKQIITRHPADKAGPTHHISIRSGAAHGRVNLFADRSAINAEFIPVKCACGI